MPRIPESAVTVGLRGVSDQPIREKLEIGQAIMGLNEASIELTSRLAEADRAQEFSRKSASIEGSLVDLQLAIQQDPSLNTVEAAEQAFTAGAEQIFTGLGQSSSTAVNQAIEKQFLQSSLQSRVRVKQAAFKRQSDNAIAGLDSDIETLERAYAYAPDDAKRAEIRANQAQITNLNYYISEQEKGDRIRDFETATSTARIRSLINSDQFDAADELLNSDSLMGIDPVQHAALTKTLDSARRRASRELKSDLKTIEIKKTQDMMRRFYDPNDPRGVPDQMDVLNAEFTSRATADFFMKMVEKDASGVDLNVVNDNVYNDLYTGVYDGRITDFNQILPRVGNGIDPETAEKLRLDIEGMKTPQRKAELEAFKIALDFAKTSILGNALISGNDPEGAELFKEAHIELRKRFDQGLKEGHNHLDMIKSGHKHYIGDFINHPPFLRTNMEVMNSKMQAMRDASERNRNGGAAPTKTPRITTDEDTVEHFDGFVKGLGGAP